MGDLISSRALIAPIAKKQEYEFFSFEYRLAPEHPFPAAFDDAKEAYEYVLGQGYSPEILLPLENQQAEAWRFLIFLEAYCRGKGSSSVSCDYFTLERPHCNWSDIFPQ